MDLEVECANLAPNWHRAESFGTRMFGTVATAALQPAPRTPTKSGTLLISRQLELFGIAGALCQYMMLQLINPAPASHGPQCAREQARELLEGFRATYRSLSFAERIWVKGAIWEAERAQLMQERDQEEVMLQISVLKAEIQEEI